MCVAECSTENTPVHQVQSPLFTGKYVPYAQKPKMNDG